VAAFQNTRYRPWSRTVMGRLMTWTIRATEPAHRQAASGSVQISRGPLDRPRAVTRAEAATTLLDTVEGPAYTPTAINIAGS
jgi:hypothetical protein